MPVIGKTVERSLYNKLTELIPKYQMLNYAQFGFQMKPRIIGVRVSLIEETRYQWDSHSKKHNANSWTCTKYFTLQTKIFS